MIYATKIKMMPGCSIPHRLVEIDEIFLDGCANPGFFKKADVHDFLKANPHSIKVDIYPNPYLIPATSSLNEKYVRSTPNDSTHDNLLDLPKI